MRSYGFAETDDDRTVGSLIAGKDGRLPDLVHAHPSDTVRDVVDIMTTYGVSQMPVLSADHLAHHDRGLGAVEEKALLEQVFTGAASMADALSGFVGDPLPLIGVGESVSAARRALETADALLVVADGKPVTVLTRHDLLTYLSD
jgi:cystathionine beta-synthase